MNWKLIFQLSLFGLVMAVATAFWIPGNIEPILWLPIFILCAYIIAKKAKGKYFQHGFLVSLVNCVWITSAHVIFAKVYLSHHPEEMEMMGKMPMPQHPRLMMLLIGPLFGILFGLILGLFSFIAGKLIKKAN